MEKLATCGTTCGKLIKATPVLVAVYCANYDYYDTDRFECGWCANNDLWTIGEMLWSEADDFFVTPCCHTEAIVALVPDKVRNDIDAQDREDRLEYYKAITGR